MNKTPVNNLLDLVNQIHAKYVEINRITGFDFNVFDILELSKDEVRLHSNFIAQLLSPIGSHGQGSLYLDLFLRILNDRIISSHKNNNNIGQNTVMLDPKTTKVSVELYIGKRTDEEGGRLDIICQDRKNSKIIIENKIDAPDQENQLLRYRKYDKNATLIYLTKFGTEPSNKSLGSKKFIDLNVVLISYETDITNWLELCLKESYQLPVIRETIFQYLNSIKKITNQIEIREMDNEIVNLLVENGEKITSAILIEQSVKDAKRLLLKKFGTELKSKLAVKYRTKAVVEMDDHFGDKYAGIIVYSKQTERVFFQISFLRDMSHFYLEIYNADNVENRKIKKKDESNLAYYRDHLNVKCKPLGQIQNVNSGWWGDWVCSYSKLDNYFSTENGWCELADKNYEIVTTVVKDLSPIIDVMLERLKSSKT